MLKIYLDLCVYNRPFDDQRHERIFIEARAFYVILKWVEEEWICCINSDALEYENSLTSDPDRRIRVKTYLEKAKLYVKISDPIIKRAHEIVKLGFRGMDSLHIAMAEYGKADYLVTCDDGIIKRYERMRKKIKVKICSLLKFIEEVSPDVANGR